MQVLKLMYNVLFNESPKFAIYPGTSAAKLDTLISLNIGWNANFRVLLDSDDAGKTAAKKYKDAFNLDKEIMLLPKDNCTIEKYFTKEERKKLYNIAFEKNISTNISKKEFAAAFSLLNVKDDIYDEVKNSLTKETIDSFEELFKLLPI